MIPPIGGGGGGSENRGTLFVGVPLREFFSTWGIEEVPLFWDMPMLIRVELGRLGTSHSYALDHHSYMLLIVLLCCYTSLCSALFYYITLCFFLKFVYVILTVYPKP